MTFAQQGTWGMQAPVGWPTQWPPAPPLGYGMAPPAPPGVDSRRWGSGKWYMNPIFQFHPGVNPGANTQGWLAHPSWGPQAADFNPFKRKPNPGNAEYWATKLTDNGLGLSDMTPCVLFILLPLHHLIIVQPTPIDLQR